jgi:hypothetical protein
VPIVIDLRNGNAIKGVEADLNFCDGAVLLHVPAATIRHLSLPVLHTGTQGCTLI